MGIVLKGYENPRKKQEELQKKLSGINLPLDMTKRIANTIKLNEMNMPEEEKRIRQMSSDELFNRNSVANPFQLQQRLSDTMPENGISFNDIMDFAGNLTTSKASKLAPIAAKITAEKTPMGQSLINKGIDIASTTDGWINTKALDDGFDWYDPFAMIGSTAADVGLDVLQGGLETIEGMTDTAQYLYADLESLFGNDALADAIRHNADFNSYGAWFGTNENEEDNLLPKGWQNGIEKYSLSGEKLDNVTRSMGQVGTHILTGGLVGNSALPNAMVIFSSSYGNSKSEAKRNGASEEDARKYAFVNATAETLSEQMFDAVPFLKTAGWGNKTLEKTLNKYFKGENGKIILRALSSIEEGTEEIFSNLFNVTGTYIADLIEKARGNENGFEYGMQRYSGNFLNDLKDTLTSEETWDAFFSAALSTTLMNAGNNIVNNTKYKNAINKYAKENNVSVEQAEADFKKILDATIEDNKSKDMNLKEQYEMEDAIKRQLTKDVKNGLNLQEEAKNAEIRMAQKLSEDTFEKSLVRNGFDPNDEAWQSVSKVLEKRGIKGIVDEQYFNDNSENALLINDGNGNRIMAFNPNADTNTIIQANTVHELVHDLISSENSKRKLLGIKTGEEIKDSDIIKYFEKLDGYQEARASLEKVYSTIKDKNGNLIYDPSSENFSKMIDEEVVAKVLEKNLGTQETINRLVHENRNFAQRIYDWIMNKIKNRGGIIRDEELYWRNVANRFVKAFNMEYENSNEASTRLSKEVNLPTTNDYEEYQKEIDKIYQKAKENVNENFANELKKQRDEYNERHQLETNIYKDTKSRPVKNINDSFFKEHESDFDGKTGTKDNDGIITSMKLQKGDNLAKVTFTEGRDKIWIDELYIKNQKQGYGTEIVNSIKQYAEENGKTVETYNELKTAKGFWDKTLRNDNQFEKNSDLWYNQNDPDYIGLIAARPEIEDYSKYSMLKKWLDKPTPELDRISKMLSEDAINKRNQGLTESDYKDVDGKTVYDYNITNDEYNFSVKDIYEYTNEMEGTYGKNVGQDSKTIVSNESKGRESQFNSDVLLQNSRESTTNDNLSREQYEEWFNKKRNKGRSKKNQGQKELITPFNNAKENLPLAQDTKLSLSQDNEQINVIQNGELKTYNNYYDFAKSITKNNNNDLAKKLLFKNYTYKFELPTSENETSLYHGTDGVNNYDDFKVMDFDEKTMDRNYGDYFYIINDKSGAKTYGNNIAQFIVPNDKIMTLEEYRNSNQNENELFEKYWAIEMPDGEYIVNDPKQIIDYSKQKAQEYIKEREKINLPLDTKFSLNQDNQGRTLTKEQQDYFKDVSPDLKDENGNIKVLYHVTDKDFNIFEADKMGKNTGEKLNGIYMSEKPIGAYGDRAIELYANITNPVKPGLKNITKEQFEQLVKGHTSDSNIESAWARYKNTDDLTILESINKLYKHNRNYKNPQEFFDNVKEITGYDGAIYEGERYYGDNKTAYVAFNSNQVKNTDNKKPTSNPDIRYSKQAKEFNEFLEKNLKDTGTTGDLMAIHNLNEEKLKGMLELGGTAYPSIAITTPSTISHEGYGNISVLFDKSTIDPANKLNKVYSRDAYTPRFPTIEYKLDSNVKRQIRETIGDYDYRNVKPGDEYISDAYGIMDNIEENINRSGLDRALEDVKNNDAMKYVYLKNTNPDFKVETKNETYSQKYNNETLQRFIDNYDGEYELNDIPSSEVEKYVSKMVDAYKQQLETEKGNENDLSQKLIDVRLDKLRNEFYEKNNFLMAAYKLQKYGTEKQVLDKQATREKMNNMINQEEYNQWVDKLFENIIEKKGLRNNKDYYTSSGNPRSFEQLHDEYTLENVVKIMSELNDTGEEGGFFYGISEIAGNASQRFNSIEDIKANKNLLTTVGDEEYHQILDNMQERLSEIEGNVMERGQNNSDNYFIARDNMASVIADAARIFGEGKKIDANKIQKMLKEYGFEVTTEESQKILDMFSEMRNLPTQYFEAKPQRAVGLDEVQAVVIPNTASESLRKQLNDAGFDFVEYDPTIEGDRQRVINKFDNLKFDKNSPEWDEFVNKHTTTKGTRTKLGDTRLPMVETNLPTSQTNLPIDNELANYLDKRYTELKDEISSLNKTIQNLPIKETKPKKAKKKVNLPTVENIEAKQTTKEKSTMPAIKKDDVIKISNDISKQINETGDFKLRKWTETSTESDVLKGDVFIEDLDPGKITYEVQSNRKSLDEANNHISTYGYEKSLQDAKSLLRSNKMPTASDVAFLQRMIQESAKRGDYETVQDLLMDTAILGTDLGQATQALSIIQRLTPEGQLKLYTKLVQRAKSRGEKSFTNVEITPEMVQKVLEVYNQDGTYDQNKLNEKVEEFKQDIAKQMKTTALEKIDAWRYLSMLGNPKTHIRNLISNIAMKETIKVKNAMARTLETILPVKERTKTWKRTTPEIKDYAKKTAQEMQDIIQGKAKYDEKSQLEAEKQIFKTKFLETIRKANGNALEFEDWLFSKSAFINSFQEYLTANNINTKEDVRNNPKLVQKAKNYAVEQAEIATFRQYSKMASMISNIERKSKPAKFLIGATLPFKKTPINVAKAGLNYSPLGLTKNMTYDTYRLIKGDINGSQYIDHISQGLTGTTLTILGYALAKAGFLNGSGGDDKEGKYDAQLGNTGYSINIGDKSYTISWLSPTAMPLLVGANAYEQLEEGKEWDMNVVSDSLAKILDPLNEMSFLQGLTNALQSYGSGADKIKGSLESIAQSYIGQFFPTLFSQIASVTDDKKRSTKASNNSVYKFGEQTVRSVMYKLPIARQQLEVATDIWGNEKEQSDNLVERTFESFLAPYSKSEHIETKLDNELKKVYGETGETKVLPSVPYGYIKSGNETYKMSASEFTTFKKNYGQTANKMLNSLIDTQSYKDASYEEKVDMIDDVYEYSREKAKEKYFKSIGKTYTSDNLTKYKKVEYVAPYDKYIGYKSEIDAIKKKYKSTEDMTSKQKTAMTNKRKEEVQKYINTLSLNRQQKLMLQKFAGNYSVNDYKKELRQYIESLKISKADKETLDKELFG